MTSDPRNLKPLALRPLGSTGMEVSCLGLGTVKIGRNEGVKYPTGFDLPDDQQVRELLTLARELGINLIDTAPAYGSSEERLGQLLTNRQDWVICSKVGEEFVDGKSFFNFSAAHLRRSIVGPHPHGVGVVPLVDAHDVPPSPGPLAVGPTGITVERGPESNMSGKC